jgi:hypothetical protein
MASNQAAKITKFDIISNDGSTVSLLGKGSLVQVEYRECILDNTVRIHALYMDGGQSGGDVGSVEYLKLQGDEKVSFSVTHDEKTLSFDKNLRIQSWSSQENELQVAIELFIVSKDFLDNITEDVSVIPFYSGKISDSVSKILKESLKTSFEIDVDETINTKSFHGKFKEPFEICTNLCRYSVPTENGKKGETSGYLFFHTSKGYKFKSVDCLFAADPVSKFIKNNTPYLPPGYDGKIHEDNLSKSVDLEKQLRSGAYGSRMKKWNPLTMKYDTKTTKTYEGKPSGITIAGTSLPKFPDYSGKITRINTTNVDIAQRFSPGDSVKSQFKSIQKENIIVDDVINQSARLNQMILKEIVVTTDGDLGVSAGDIVFCDFRENSVKKNTEVSKKTGGKYMVSGLCHLFIPSNTYTKMSLVRDSDGRVV